MAHYKLHSNTAGVVEDHHISLLAASGDPEVPACRLQHSKQDTPLPVAHFICHTSAMLLLKQFGMWKHPECPEAMIGSCPARIHRGLMYSGLSPNPHHQLSQQQGCKQHTANSDRGKRSTKGSVVFVEHHRASREQTAMRNATHQALRDATHQAQPQMCT